MKHIYRVVLCYLITLISGISASLYAQDVHFSQIHASPTYLNPALNGLFEGDYRLIANYRQQWRSVTANYRTIAASFDTKLLDMGGQGYLSLGTSFYSDKAGDLDFSTTQFNLALAATKALNSYNNQFLTAGFQAGMIRNSLDYSKMYVFDIEPTVANSAPDQVIALDLSAGLAWSLAVSKKYNFYAGISLFHINQPDLAMIGQTLDYEERLRHKWVMVGGAELAMNRRMSVMPSFIFMEQVPHREITIGSYFRYLFSKTGYETSDAIMFGAWFRWFYRPDINTSSDAVVLSVRLDNNRVSYAFSYDINLSSLTRASKGQGGPELSIIYRGVISKPGSRFKSRLPRNKIKCPTF